jgi:hypothetical protein
MTDTIIDLRYLAESQPSLCIPRVFNNIDESRIRQVFNELGLGKIHHIDVIERKNEKGEPFKRAYIHFESWYWNEDAQAARRKLITGKEIKIVYDNPWFWKVSANKWTPSNDRRDEGPRQISRPHIEFEDRPPRRDRDLDEFGRSNVMRKETDNRRPQRRDDNRRSEKRDDNRRPEKREESREKRRPEKRDDQRRPAEEKIEKEIPAPCSPISSPPREYFMETPIDYGDLSKSIPKRRIQLLKKKTPPVPVVAPLPVIEKKTVELQIEEGEVVDEVIDEVAEEMSEAEKKSYDELYGDL